MPSRKPVSLDADLAFADPSKDAGSLLDGVELRTITADHLEAAEALSRTFRWPHRLQDWHFALAHGDGVVAARDGEVVATAMRWLWGRHHATLGMVIVAPHMQGRRMGHHLMMSLLAGIENRSILLHATSEGRGLYERAGFTTTGEVRQHQGIAAPPQLVALPHAHRLRPVGRNDPKALVALDARAAGMPRDKMLRDLLAAGEAVVLTDGAQPIGFSVLRRFGKGYAIGPVVAPDLACAQALIGYWCGRYAGRFLRVDVEATSGLPEWLEAAGLPRVGMVSTMVRGAQVQRGPSVGGWALVNQAMG